MSDFIEWVPKHHGHQPLHWEPDMLTSVDGKNFVRQPNWAWIAGSVYYVPPEAVGMVREDVEPEPALADEELIEELSEMGGHYCRAHLPMGERLRQASDRLEALKAEVERLRGEHVIELATGQQQLDELANQLSALRAASIALRDDLLSRAEWDKDAGKVVCAGNGVWLKFNEALEKQP